MKEVTIGLFAFLLNLSVAQAAANVYVIQVAHNDEFFIINDNKYSAKTYCLGWEEGERVIFIDGSPNGICTSAVLYNIDRKKECRVWCE